MRRLTGVLLLLMSVVSWAQNTTQKTLPLKVYQGIVVLSWNASATPGVTYNMYRSTSPDTGFVLIGNVSVLTFQDKPPHLVITQPLTYYYRLTATLNGQESSYVQVSATLPATSQ